MQVIERTEGHYDVQEVEFGTVEQARDIVSWTRYPPLASRSSK